MKNTILFFVAIVIAGSSGFAVHRYMNQQQDLNNPVIGQQRPEFAVPDLNGDFQNIKQWDGKLLFLNFWATWCYPCKQEIPTFMELQRAYGDQGFQIVGLAIDDIDAVKEYVEEIGLNYPTMVAEQAGIELAKRYGNPKGLLPYTVVIDRDGEISSTIKGELSKKRAEEILAEHGIKLQSM
ncbi:MAG: TlpA family protein disulfide reductase [Proteobacteria bacterium]|nr:TlpA family protein disulfide reductase [Pseudomonadota bacterium]